jgi:hypothetical protein
LVDGAMDGLLGLNTTRITWVHSNTS